MKRFLWLLVLVVLAGLVMLPVSPAFIKTPTHDSGIFLYFGSQILHGQLPFRDLWDHKPPAVFYVDALGLLLGGSRWGVWMMEVLSLSAAGGFAFAFLSSFFGSGPAAFGVAGLFLNLVLVLEQGNLTEEYALPFQFAGLYLFARAERRGRYGWLGIGMGLAMAGAFLLKQTLVGVWLVIGLYILITRLAKRDGRGFVSAILPIAAGAAAGLGMVVLYFAANRSLPAFWDVAFRYNFIYSDVTNGDRLRSLLALGQFLLSSSGFYMITTTAWLAGIGYLLLKSERAARIVTRRWLSLVFFFCGGLLIARNLQSSYLQSGLSLYRVAQISAGAAIFLLGMPFAAGWMERRAYPWLRRHALPGSDRPVLPVTLAVMGMPVEMILISLSGEGYKHYFMSLLPVLVTLAGFFAYSWLQAAGGGQRRLASLWLLVLVLPFGYNGAFTLIQMAHPGADLQTSTTTAYIQAHTLPSDKILLWGSQTGIYFLSGRQSPTRFTHQFPLFNPKYTDRAKVDEVLKDLQTKRPVLIIDAKHPAAPFIGSACNPGCDCSPASLPKGMADLFSYVCQKYRFVEVIGPDAWPVYQLKTTDAR